MIERQYDWIKDPGVRARQIEYSWWSNRVGEESPVYKILDKLGRVGPERHDELVWRLQKAVADLMQAVDEKYPTDTCRACGR